MEFYLPNDEPELWQLAVRLHVLMCYPDAPADRHQRLCNAIGAQMIAVTLKQVQIDSPEDLNRSRIELAARFPGHDWKARRNISEKFIEHHEQALRVGSIVLAMVSEAATGKYPAFVGRSRQPSRKEIARYLLENKGVVFGEGEGISERGTDAEDILHQFLKAKVKPWYPVAHLAAAFQLTAREDTVRGATMSFDYHDADFFAKILDRAHATAEHIRATSNACGIAKMLVPLDEFDRLRR